MNEKEKLMYSILAKISNTDAPIVFKGALITKLILAEHEFDKIKRMTKDIDANWVGKPPSMQILVNTINKALGGHGEYEAVASREYGEKKSAGVKIVKKNTDDEVISIDIDMKPLVGSKIYYIGETNIRGVLANEILADKISSMSSDAVYKHRAKDIVDVYSLTHCIKVKTSDIYNICKKVNREIQPFTAFFNRKNEIEHAYNKLRGIEGKPEFSEVYCYLKEFVKPFAEKDYSEKIWNGINHWENEQRFNTMDDWKKEIYETKKNEKEKNEKEKENNEPHKGQEHNGSNDR